MRCVAPLFRWKGAENDLMIHITGPIACHMDRVGRSGKRGALRTRNIANHIYALDHDINGSGYCPITGNAQGKRPFGLLAPVITPKIAWMPVSIYGTGGIAFLVWGSGLGLLL